MCTLFAPQSRTAIERSNLSPLDQNRERSRRCSAASTSTLTSCGACYEAIKDEELCFTQGHQQEITALKQELRRAQQVKKKTEAQIAKSEKKLAAANAAITVLAKYLVTGKTGRDDDRR